MSGARYAIYYAPPRGSALDRFGSAWLARDVHSGEAVPPLRIEGLPAARQQEITADARHYGFHGTLKPPFALAPGRRVEELHAAVASFAAARAPFTGPPLRLARLSGFLALVPSAPFPALHALADNCVRVFDPFRAAASPEELERRRRVGLSARQEEYLMRWGYPYVFEDFRFHLTLTCRLSDDEAAAVARGLAPVVAPLCAPPLAIDRIALFEQETRAMPFRLVRSFPFGGSTDER